MADCKSPRAKPYNNEKQSVSQAFHERNPKSCKCARKCILSAKTRLKLLTCAKNAPGTAQTRESFGDLSGRFGEVRGGYLWSPNPIKIAWIWPLKFGDLFGDLSGRFGEVAQNPKILSLTHFNEISHAPD